ncbi:DMT family transporter [Selenomonadales bacterium 4137-cl]|uniref:DMT family transporter n=2 Tax=Anaeroselena agilis TaxID=3063788 RepID=A0ABU3P1B5_9FIRM|nr:DMT family transporter [Selenomonadales bacterium 4137-cl]
MVLFFVAFMWGIHPAIVKIGLVTLPPVPYNALRLLLATAVAWGAVWASGTYRPVAREDVRLLVQISLAGFFVFQLFFAAGVEKTTAGNASLVVCMLPVSVAVINRVCGLEPITGRMAAGIAASLAGVVLIVLGSGKEISVASEHWKGALLLLGAQAGYGYYTVFSRRLLGRYSAYQVTAVVVTISTALFAVMALPDLAAISWGGVPVAAWLSVAYSGVFAMCVGNFLWVWGVGRIGSARTSLFNNFAPVFAVVSGYYLLGEAFGLMQMAGAAVIFWGLYYARPKQAGLPAAPARAAGRED